MPPARALPPCLRANQAASPSCSITAWRHLTSWVAAPICFSACNPPGCIPVIINDNVEPVLHGVVDWSKFSVRVPQARLQVRAAGR